MDIIRQMVLGAVVGLVVGFCQPRVAEYHAFQPMPVLSPVGVEAPDKKAHSF